MNNNNVEIFNKEEIENAFSYIEMTYKRSRYSYELLSLQQIILVEFEVWVPICLLDLLVNDLPF